jgi:poly-gamma-glutamate capsule biosynthesis protein CapA/YwtB (metallophosphatase superfamily)
MDQPLCLFVCGDVMTGRGIDQILPHPCPPHLFEPYVHDARDYLQLAETAHGPIPYPVAYKYIWGEALAELDRAGTDARIINLETSVTTRNDYWPGKTVHYRMHPANIGCLTAAGIDCCTLANNHVLDWGYEGLAETLATLDEAGIRHAGAGNNLEQAQAPAILHPCPMTQATGHEPRITDHGPRATDQHILVFAFGSITSGIPQEWAAGPRQPGVNLLEDLSESAAQRLAAQMRAAKGPDDMVVASIHWGGNWGYGIPDAQLRFAHRLIDEGIDLVHGHSSHHTKALEIYRGRPILYGCGDFLTDYEGIGGYEAFRGDLALMYLIQLAPSSAELTELRLVPLQVRHFQLRRASAADVQWLHQMLNRQSAPFGAQVSLNPDHSLTVHVPRDT